MSISRIYSNEIEDVIREQFGENCVIVDVSSEPVVEDGENFTSSIKRLIVTFKTSRSDESKVESVSYIVKSSQSKDVFDSEFASKLFATESSISRDVLPIINQILGGEPKLTPNCVSISLKQPESLIVLEDLKPLGFAMCDRQKGLDLEHCLKVIEGIAKFHAASVLLDEMQENSKLKTFKRGLFHTEDDLTKFWLTLALKCLIKVAATWPNFENTVRKLAQVGAEKLLDKCIKASISNPNGCNVLNHGDLWVNNMMFSYDQEGRVEDVRFLDFQLCLYSSPCIDLHYFFSTSVKNEVRGESLDYLLDFYFVEFISTLSRVNFPLDRVWSKREFLEDFRGRAAYGLLTSAAVAPFAKADKGRKDANFKELYENGKVGGFRDHIYSNERYRDFMVQLLPYFVDLIFQESVDS